MPVGEFSGMTASVETGGPELLEQFAEPWRELCREGPSSEPFYRPEWVAAFLRAFEPRESSVRLITASSGNRLTAVLPLVDVKARRCGVTVRKLRGAANVFSCRFDLARSAGPEGEQGAQAIWECLRDRLDWDVVELPDVPEGGAAEALLDAARKDGFPTGQWETIRTPYIPLDGTADAAAAATDPRFRQNLRRRLRRAQAQWPVRLRRYDSADPDALERFYRLEASGWKGRRKTAIDCSAATRRFHDEVARAADRFGYFSLYLLEFGDQVVAGHFGLTYGGRYFTPKGAYDETFAAYGPGHLIVDAVLRDCIERGVREFDFLGPWTEFKGAWTREVRRHSHCYVFRRGAFGRALYLATFKLSTALRRAARRRSIAAIRRRLQSTDGH